MSRDPSPFGERTQQAKLSIKIRYFLAFEGEKTERIYFEGLKKEIDTNLIEIIDLGPRKNGYSHPTQVLEQILKLQEEMGMTKYDKDQKCMIVDRDPSSFKEDDKHKQYTEIVSECKGNGIKLYVTNPRFEFWLLLHFFSKDQLDLKKISAPREPNKERYIENCLHTCYPTFKKSNYDFTRFKDNIPTAIENEKSFCQDLDQLKDNIGSNIGILVTQLLPAERIER